MTPPPVVAGRYRLDEPLRPGLDKTSFRGVEIGANRPVLAAIVEEDVAEATRRRARVVHPSFSHVVAVVPLDELSDRPGSLPPAAKAVAVLEGPWGPTLEAKVSQGSVLTTSAALRLFVPLATALVGLHGEGCHHGAILPASIEVSPDGKLRLSLCGGYPGSLAFSSPDRITGGSLSYADDTWALAACLYFAVTGQTPYSAESPQALARRILGGRPLPLQSNSPGTADLQRIFDRAFARNETQRFRTATEFRDELGQLQTRLPTVEPAPPEAPQLPVSAPTPPAQTATWVNQHKTQPDLPRTNARRRTKAFESEAPPPLPDSPHLTQSKPRSPTLPAPAPTLTTSESAKTPSPAAAASKAASTQQRTEPAAPVPVASPLTEGPSTPPATPRARKLVDPAEEPAFPRKEHRTVSGLGPPGPPLSLDEPDTGNDRPTMPGSIPSPIAAEMKRVPSVLTSAVVAPTTARPPSADQPPPTRRRRPEEDEVLTSAPELPTSTSHPAESSRPTIHNPESSRPTVHTPDALSAVPNDALPSTRTPALVDAPEPKAAPHQVATPVAPIATPAASAASPSASAPPVAGPTPISLSPEPLPPAPEPRATPRQPVTDEFEDDFADGPQGATRPFSREQVDQLRENLTAQGESLSALPVSPPVGDTPSSPHVSSVGSPGTELEFAL